MGSRSSNREQQPLTDEDWCSGSVFGKDCVDRRVKRFRVCVLLEINPGASYPAGNIFGSYRQHPIKRRTHFFVATQSLVREGDLLKYGEVARIQLQCMVHFLERLFPMPLAPVDVGS